MAFFAERHRWPSSCRASPSPRVIKKASSSPTLLDSLLTVKTERLSPGLGFGLAAAYRNSPSSPSHSPSSTSTSSAPPQFTSALIAQGTQSGRVTPQSPLTPVPLARTRSAPPATGWGMDTDNMQVDAEGFPSVELAPEQEEWRCPGCGTKERPEPNRDAQMTCLNCGTGISGDPRMDDGIRQSNCPLAEAKDQVANMPGPTPEQVHINALIEGDEGPQQRKARLLAASGGTQIHSARGHHGTELQRGDRIVRASVQKELTARIEGDSVEARKNQDVLKRLQQLLDQLNPTLHNNLQRHVKFEAVRIVSAFFVHEGVCGRGCGVTQTGASAKMLAGCLLEGLLTKLCAEHDSVATAKHAPGMTKEQFEKVIAQVKAPKGSRNGGTMNRQQVLSSVGLFLRWSDQKICMPCPPPPAPAPPSLRQAADRQHADYGCGRTIAPDPYDPMEKLRQRVNSVGTMMLHVHPDLRNGALRALWDPKTIEFLAATPLPADLVALCLLTAIADKDEESDPQDVDRIHVLTNTTCDQHQITPWTASEFTKQLGAILPEPEPVMTANGLLVKPPTATPSGAAPSPSTAPSFF